MVKQEADRLVLHYRTMFNTQHLDSENYDVNEIVNRLLNKDKADKDAEMKVDIRPFDGTGGKITVDFNAAGDKNKPKVSEITPSDVALDWTQAIEVWVKFEPNEVFSEYKPDPEAEEVRYREYCKVSIGVNGKFVRSFDTSLELFRTCFWNTEFRLYMGMYNAFGNAICESYDFYAPINWDD